MSTSKTVQLTPSRTSFGVGNQSISIAPFLTSRPPQTQTCSSPCSRSRRTLRRTPSSMCSFSESSGLIRLTTSPRRRDATTRSSLTQDYGAQLSPRRTATGQSVALCHTPRTGLTNRRVYYMFANIANLNNWRRERGFSESADTGSR